MTSTYITTECNGLQVHSREIVANTTPSTKEEARNELQKLSEERADWEANEFASSRTRLYHLLTRCYSFYLTMTSDGEKNTRKELREGLEALLAEKNYNFKASTSPMNKIVQAVFGLNSRRVSAYALTLRVALTAMPGDKRVDIQNLATWISENGGVEEIRQASKNDGLKLSERIDIAKATIADAPHATVKLDAKSFAMSTDDTDKLLVFIGTYRPNGSVELNGIVRMQSAVNAALLAYYNENKKAGEATALPVSVNAHSAVATAFASAGAA